MTRLGRYQHNGNPVIGNESFETVAAISDNIASMFYFLKNKIKQQIYISKKGKRDYNSEFIDIIKQASLIGKKLNKAQFISYLTKLLNKDKWPNEVLYTEKMFQEDMKKYCSDGRDIYDGKEIDESSYRTNFPGQ